MDFRGLARQSGLSKQTVGNIIEFILANTSQFADTFIQPGTVQEREQMASQRMNPGLFVLLSCCSWFLFPCFILIGFYPDFDVVTGCVDGTHISVESDNDKLYSYKSTKHGFCVIAVLLPNQCWGFVSQPFPATDNDLVVMRHIREKFNAVFTKRDCLAADGIFNPLNEEKEGFDATFLCPNRKPKGRLLRSDLARENVALESERGPIERRFGDLKSRFAILSDRFRLKKNLEVTFEVTVRICFALDNIHRSVLPGEDEDALQYTYFSEQDGSQSVHVSEDEVIESEPITIADKVAAMRRLKMRLDQEDEQTQEEELLLHEEKVESNEESLPEAKEAEEKTDVTSAATTDEGRPKKKRKPTTKGYKPPRKKRWTRKRRG